MQRYFLDVPAFENERYTLNKEDSFHVIRVMRMRVFQEVIVVGSNQKAYISVIESLDNDQVVVDTKTLLETRELDVNVTIGLGLLKGDKYDLVVQKLTELGVFTIQPLQMKRSIVKLDEKKYLKKQERWQKIAKEASEQSHRSYIPEVLSLKSLKQIDFNEFDHIFVAYEEVSMKKISISFKEYLNSVNKSDRIIMIIGPEGGLDEQEVDYLVSQGAKTISLGKRILRAETAPIYCMSVIGYEREL